MWCVWAYEQVPGERKPRKVPQYTRGGRRHGQQGTPEDLAKLTTFAGARDAAMKRGLDGVGFALIAESGIVALDFDHCVRDGAVDPQVLDLVRDTYAEYSPSGTGVRAFFRGNLGNRKSPAQGNPFGFETFTSSGFVTVTGWMLDHVELLGLEDIIAPVPPRVQAYCEQRFGPLKPDFDPDDFMAGREPRLGLSVAKMEELLDVLDADMSRDEWVRVGMALHHECDGDDTGFDLWDAWSSNGEKYPGEEALRQQWESFTRRAGPGRRQITMASVIHMAKEAGYRPVDTVDREEVLAKAEAKAEAILADDTVRGRFTPVPIGELSKRPGGEWLIKAVLPKGELGVLFGSSGSGKTFVALDLAFAIARGVPWRERRVRQGRVAVIAAEGGAGIGKRADAYSRHHGFDLAGVDIHVITAAPNFLGDDDIAEVIGELKAHGPFDLVVVDTLAQVSPGANENTSEDMSRVLGHLRLLHEATGAMILAVHHAGKDLTKGSRGWSGIKAAADVQIEVARHENGDREIHIEKMKDGEDGLRWGFKLETVLLGLDSDGDDITSCVAVEAELPRASSDAVDRKGVKRRGRIENHCLEVATMYDTDTVSAEEFIKRATEMLPPPEEGSRRDTRRQSVVRAINNLTKEKDGPLQMVGSKIVFFE